MEIFFLLLPALGCTLMMVACAAMMWGGHRMATRRASASTDNAGASSTRVPDSTR